MIRHFTVKGLNDRHDHSLTFYRDLNIITGKNGSGKTTLLKLMWYMLSSNIERTIPEICFSSAELRTDRFAVSIVRKKKGKQKLVELKWSTRGSRWSRLLPPEAFGDSSSPVEKANRDILPLSGQSIFFPTFRRIEGGFSLASKRDYRTESYRPRMRIAEALSEYSDSISVKRHRLVASLSTNDIEELLTRQYADVSESTNQLHANLSGFISNRVGTHRVSAPTIRSLRQATKLLSAIRKKAAQTEQS